METCNLKIKDIDPSLKIKLKVNSTSPNTKYQNETDQSETDDSDDSRNNIRLNKTNNYKSKHLQTTGPKVFMKKPEQNKTTNKINNGPKKFVTILKNNDSKNVQSKTYSNSSNVDELKSKMSKFLNTSSGGHEFSNNTNLMGTESLRNLRTQAEIEQYTKQLYQNILTNQLHQFNMHNSNPQGFDRLFNQNHTNVNNTFSQLSFKNSQPPPLLSLRPNVSQHDLRRIQQQSNKINPKKK